MRKACLAFVLVAACAVTVWPQAVTVTASAVKLAGATPSGACPRRGAVLLDAGTVYVCPESGTQEWAAVGGGAAANVTVGTSVITGGTTTRVLYNNAGVLGEYTITGTAGSVVMSVGPTLTGTLDAQAATFGNAVSLTSTTAANNKITQGAAINIGTTSTDGIILQNTTAAAAGAQQYSPRLRLIGQGWKTNATAASQTVEWQAENRPVQGSANPSTNLAFSTQINSGGWTDILTLVSGGQVLFPTGASTLPAIAPAAAPTTGIYFFGGNTVTMLTLGTLRGSIKSTGLGLTSTGQFGWTNSAGDSTASDDTGIARVSAGLTRFTNGSTGIGATGFAFPQSTKTAGHTVLNTETGYAFDNIGAAGSVTFTLPTPAAGLQYRFCRVANQAVVVDVGASVTVQIGASATTSGGDVSLDAVGSCVHIWAVSTTQWFGVLAGSATFN